MNPGPLRSACTQHHMGSTTSGKDTKNTHLVFIETDRTALLWPCLLFCQALSQFIWVSGGGLELEMRQFNEVLIFTGTEHRPRDPRWMFARRAALPFFSVCLVFVFLNQKPASIVLS